jgi:hypothetical protein
MSAYFGSITLNILFAFYILFFSSRLLGWSRDVVNTGESNWILGILIILALVVEPIALLYKEKRLKKKLAGEKIEIPGGLAFSLWMAHCVLGILMTMTVLTAFGVSSENLSATGFIVILIAVARELFIGYFFFLSDVKPDSNSNNPVPELVLDIALFFFSCIAYTSTWGIVSQNADPLNEQNIALTLLNVACAFILFLIFFLPARMFYFIEEYLLARNKKELTTIALSVLLAGACALSGLFVFKYGKIFLSPSDIKEIRRIHTGQYNQP